MGQSGNELATVSLPAEQQQALELLVSGKSVAETAREAGVSRTTLYRWLKADDAFKAAYNQWQEELQESVKSRMLTMMARAAEAVEKSLEAGDGRLGLRVLEKMGMAAPVKVGPTEAEAVKRKRVRDEIFKEME